MTGACLKAAEIVPITTIRHDISKMVQVTVQRKLRKVFRIGTLRYHWPMSTYASQAFSRASCTDLEDLPKLQLGKATVSDRHQIKVRVRVSSRVRVAVRFGSLSYNYLLI